MRIGTPLTPSATRVMLLGSGELGKEVIIELQRLGVEVIAVDRYPNAPGHQVAHRSHVINMTDGEALRQVIEQERPHLIVPEIEALATDTLAEIESEGLAEVIPSARATQLTMDRAGIRQFAAEELHLKTSRYAFASNPNELRMQINRGIGYPCIVKPVMSSSGKGQSVVHNADEVRAAWDFAMESGRVNRGAVIVEEFVHFDFEITLLTVRALGASGEIETFFCDPIGHVQRDGDYIESWQPHRMSISALTQAQEIGKAITERLGGRGVFGVELFIKGDQVWFSEVSPRPHDTGMVTMVTQSQSEFALHARALLGLPISTHLLRHGASAVIYGGVEAQGIVYEGLEDALLVPETQIRLFGKPEAHVKRRMGVVLANANTVEEARSRAREAVSKIRALAAETAE